MPTSRPVRLSSSTTGNRTRERPAVRLVADGLSVPVKSGMMKSATPIQTSVSAPSTTRISQNRLEARRKASCLRPWCSSSVNTGTKAADRAACENRLLNRLGTWEATVNAEAAAVMPKKLA